MALNIPAHRLNRHQIDLNTKRFAVNSVMTHRSIAVPLVAAVMIPFDKVQLSIFICGVHSKLSSKVYSLMRLCLEVENPSTFGKKTLVHLLFYFQIRFLKWPIFLLVAYWRLTT
jgi:hypothetical protein